MENKNFKFKILINFLLFIIILHMDKVSANEYGILAAESSSEKENFCIIYFKEFSTLPEEKSKAKFHILQDASELNWCDVQPHVDFKSKILLVSNNNCSVIEQAQNVQDKGAEGLLFITNPGKVARHYFNDTLTENINITVGLISETSVEKLKEMAYTNHTISVCLFAPYNANFDFSLFVIWILAVFTVIIGSYWSGNIRYTIYCKEMSALPSSQCPSHNHSHPKSSSIEESSLNLSPYIIACFVLSMGLMLVLLYFFFDYLVYVIIILFILASIMSLYTCFECLVLKIPKNYCRITNVKCGKTSCNFDFRQILLLLFSAAIPIYWFVIRNEKHAWILQDGLGIAFCIHMLKSIRLPSLKICTLLLVLLFFYDIFFVFITPYITDKGESVMEQVATGGKSKEMLPMVLKVAHLGFDPLTICYQQFSILGFGDILIPGLLVSYCHGFDLIASKKKIYFPVTVTAYGIGLLVTFGGLFLMNTAQPALLYLVPLTLLPLIILGLCRGEFSLLWNGLKAMTSNEQPPQINVQNAINDNATVNDISNGPREVPINNILVKDSGNFSKDKNEATGEQKHLLHS